MNKVQILTIGSGNVQMPPLESQVELKPALSDSLKNSLSEENPSPGEFESYLPWACKHVNLDVGVTVTRFGEQSLIRSRSRNRSKSKYKSSTTFSTGTTSSGWKKQRSSMEQGAKTEKDINVKINAIYSNDEKLVQLIFEKRPDIPANLIKVLRLIINYYPDLARISMITSSDEYILYELSKLLPLCNLSEIILDDCFLSVNNYDILLEQPGQLNYLSIARCRISDKVLKNISEKLEDRFPASKTLTVLNLSSNHISDIGASYLAKSLRTNRKLKYLNVSGNMLTDDGAKTILLTLKEFPITGQEEEAKNMRYLEYMKQRKDLFMAFMTDLANEPPPKRKTQQQNKNAQKRPNTPTKGAKPRSFAQKLRKTSVSTVNIDYKAELHKKADEMVKSTLGDFDEAFSKKYTFTRNDVLYCRGNTSLCYLNMSYNNLTMATLKRLLEVLIFQSEIKGEGLRVAGIEGNLMPKLCNDYDKIDDFLKAKLSNSEPDVKRSKNRLVTRK